MSTHVASYSLVIHVAADGEFDIGSIEPILRLGDEVERRAIIFVGDGISGPPLARFPDIEARCRAAGVTILVRTEAEYDLARAEERLPGTRRTLGSPGSDEVIDAAARAGPRHELPLAGTEDLVTAYVAPRDLPRGWTCRAPGGPMAAHLGERVRPGELSDGDERLARKLGRRVRAWRVRSLIGTAFVAADEADVSRALEVHVQKILGMPIMVPRRDSPIAYRKYLHVHASASTPPDSRTGQRMFLELYGNIAVAGEHDLRTLAGTLWRLQRYEPAFTPGRRELPALPGPLVIRLAAATWSNVSYPGVDVPFYM